MGNEYLINVFTIVINSLVFGVKAIVNLIRSHELYKQREIFKLILVLIPITIGILLAVLLGIYLT